MFLRKLDFISENNCIYYNGNKKHASKLGGILTIIAYLFILIITIYFSIDIIYKKNPTSYFFKKFIPDVGILYLNKTMYHYIQLLDPYDNVLMDEQSWMIFGTETYIDKFLLDFDINEESHWNYGPCDKNDYIEYVSVEKDQQYLKGWCIKGYWNASSREYFEKDSQNYIPPYISHGTGSKELTNIGYGIYVAKCQKTSFRSNCKTIDEINEEFKKLLRIKVSIINNNFDVTIYKNPTSQYFLDIKNHLTGNTITQNNLNFNPVAIQTNDGLILNNNKTIYSYAYDFNEKIIYERGNSTLLSGWYFLITNLCETYTRTYPKFQNVLADIGGALKAILMVAEIINFLFNQWVIIMDIQYECEKLGLEYSNFDINENLKRKSFNYLLRKKNPFDLYFNGNDIDSKENINQNISQITHYSNLTTSKMDKDNLSYRKSKIYKNIINIDRNNNSSINSFNNYNNIDIKSAENKIKKNDIQINSNIANKRKIHNINSQEKQKKFKLINFITFIKGLFKCKIKDNNTNIRLMNKFWINEISEENIVQMDLKIYKLYHRYLKKNTSTHINNFIKKPKLQRKNFTII